ncbi:MAG: caspase family protein [Alphaproteobacteria bacterium]|nr:caspase family protein [Alphaproteobacteria bacterium]
MKKYLIALGVVLVLALGGTGLWLLHQPARAADTPTSDTKESDLSDFSQWAVVLVAGDYRAHSGAPSKVFDNARHDLAAAFTKIGFKKANMVQFSVDYDDSTQHTGIPEIAAAMHEAAAKAKAGCLIYFTSHGVPTGIIMGEAVLGPEQMRDMVNSACGKRPAVIVMSSCYSGQFVAPLQADNRIIMTASRPDRTSFGCGELDQYTFFDDCFLRAMAISGDFPGLGAGVQQCVSVREQQMKATPPSEPQVSVGSAVTFTLRWRDMPPSGPFRAPPGDNKQPT